MTLRSFSSPKFQRGGPSPANARGLAANKLNPKVAVKAAKKPAVQPSVPRRTVLDVAGSQVASMGAKLVRGLGLYRTDTARLLGAISSGDAAGVRSLLEQGIDPNRPDFGGNLAVVSAASRGQLEILQALKAAGADFKAVDPVYQGTSMHAAAVRGHVEVLRFLFEEAHVDPNVQGPSNGYTAWMDAIRFRRTDAANYLRTISDPALRDFRGRTADQLQKEFDARQR